MLIGYGDADPAPKPAPAVVTAVNTLGLAAIGAALYYLVFVQQPDPHHGKRT